MSAASSFPEWPSVPACYGWLSLDRRGAWRLRGDPVRHAGLNAFIAANYEAEQGGAWVVRNGPQKVYVALDYTPWVMRLDGDGRLRTHTGRRAGEVLAAHLDEQGNVLFATTVGVGLLDDRDLADFLAQCRLSNGLPADEEALFAVMAGEGRVLWNGVTLTPIAAEDVPVRYQFDPAPAGS
ncbi:DUF2946 family protein [Azoarcus sp. L1K30]|uniref:DUF2946 family protein n=1 Tax=Azoarcus sp. L1K30 TaxID=2820277 RepID=UPI001B815C4E|nr:DUF2946 family protein [Azoarcus sp. L1K30]MBR0567928.1 DUF2946 family protein [Azoarcus sp. L1K30]